jgi:hypothetical protein
MVRGRDLQAVGEPEPAAPMSETVLGSRSVS